MAIWLSKITPLPKTTSSYKTPNALAIDVVGLFSYSFIVLEIWWARGSCAQNHHEYSLTILMMVFRAV